MQLLLSEWAMIALAGGLFFCVELMNTAVERIVDAFDKHHRPGANGYHPDLRAAKDVASGAALIALIAGVAIIGITFVTHIVMF